MGKKPSDGQILLEMILVLSLLAVLITTVLAQDFKRQKSKMEKYQKYEVMR